MWCLAALAGQAKFVFSHPSWKSGSSSCENEKPTEGMASKGNGKWISSGGAEVQESCRMFTVEPFK